MSGREARPRKIPGVALVPAAATRPSPDLVPVCRRYLADKIRRARFGRTGRSGSDRGKKAQSTPHSVENGVHERSRRFSGKAPGNLDGFVQHHSRRGRADEELGNGDPKHASLHPTHVPDPVGPCRLLEAAVNLLLPLPDGFSERTGCRQIPLTGPGESRHLGDRLGSGSGVGDAADEHLNREFTPSSAGSGRAPVHRHPLSGGMRRRRAGPDRGGGRRRDRQAARELRAARRPLAPPLRRDSP